MSTSDRSRISTEAILTVAAITVRRHSDQIRKLIMAVIGHRILKQCSVVIFLSYIFYFLYILYFLSDNVKTSEGEN